MALVGIRVVLGIADDDAPYAVEAARRLAAARPDLHVELDCREVAITGAGERDARSGWRTTLLNERLVSEADGTRADILRALVA